MTWRTLGLSILLAVAWTSAALLSVRYASGPAPMRYFVAHMEGQDYRVEAHGFRTDGFCTVFLRNDRPFAAVCGQHTVSEAVEVE